MLDDPRCNGRALHPRIDLLRQRLFAFAAGYKDLNDHTLLRRDTALKTTSSVLTDLASAPTLCRLEQRVNDTIRLKSCKVAAIVLQDTLRIRFLLPRHYPYQKSGIRVQINL